MIEVACWAGVGKSLAGSMSSFIDPGGSGTRTAQPPSRVDLQGRRSVAAMAELGDLAR